MSQKVWQDKRSGAVGSAAGNLILGRLQQIEEEPIVHEKGTVFSTSGKVFVCRVCSSPSYLQKGIVHFCNMSKDQNKAVLRYRKEVWYLFITVERPNIRFWLVPGKIVQNTMRGLKPKPNTSTCFLRITEEDGRYYLGNQDITKYYQDYSARGRAASSLKAS